MPELLEVETYRRQAERVVGRTVGAVEAPDTWFVKGSDPAEVVAAVTGRTVVGVRRRGKLLVLDLDGGGDAVDGDGAAKRGPAAGGAAGCGAAGGGAAGGGAAAGGDGGGGVGVRLGLRFGMTGRLIVAGAADIDRLEYASPRDDPVWDRFTLHFTDGTDLRIRDPRRLGGVSLDPDEGRLGVDALRATPEDVRAALGSSVAPVKARLLDQVRLAGIGNLLADEILYRAGLDPARAAGGLDDDEVTALHRAIGEVLAELMARGGSHTGDLRQAAALDGLCPRDGTPLVRRRIGGRTTLSCPAHQR